MWSRSALEAAWGAVVVGTLLASAGERPRLYSVQRDVFSRVEQSLRDLVFSRKEDTDTASFDVKCAVQTRQDLCGFSDLQWLEGGSDDALGPCSPGFTSGS